MFLSNKLLWALKDHSSMRDPILADIALASDLRTLEETRNAPDEFDRPVAVPVQINKETGEIEFSRDQ
jgi:hypothetical protein